MLAKTVDKEPTFSTVKVTPTTSAPAGIFKSTEPFIRPSDTVQPSDLAGSHNSPQSQATDKSLSSASDSQRPSTSDLHGVSQTAPRAQSTSKSRKEKSVTDRPSDLAGTDPPSFQQVSSRSSSAPAGRQSPLAMDTDSDSDFSDQPPVDIFVEEGELSDAVSTDPTRPSEDQNYRETMRGIRSYMGWSHIPDMNTTATTSDDNPFVGPQSQPTGKVSVKMPADEWLCKKMGKLNLTLVEGYPSRSSEAGGLLNDHFIALIHPIQWTIANPVGADRPAKRQKKTSCVATGWPVRSTVHSPDGASYFLPV